MNLHSHLDFSWAHQELYFIFSRNLNQTLIKKLFILSFRITALSYWLRHRPILAYCYLPNCSLCRDNYEKRPSYGLIMVYSESSKFDDGSVVSAHTRFVPVVLFTFVLVLSMQTVAGCQQ